MDIKDIIEKARAVVAAHEAWVAAGEARESPSWWELRRHEEALEFAEYSLDDTHDLARLLVAAATLPAAAVEDARAKAVTLTCDTHGVEACEATACLWSRDEHAAERKAAHRARRERRVDEPIWQRYYAALIGKGLAVDAAVMRADAALTHHRKRWPHQD